MRKVYVLFAAVLMIALVGESLAQSGGAGGTGLSPATRQALQAAFDKAVAFMRQNQKPNGSFEFHEGITGLATIGMLKNPEKNLKSDPAVEKALKFLVTVAKPDGSIFSKDMPNANTAISMMAFQASGKPEYKPYIKKGQDFLVKLQFDEEEGVKKSDPKYGGIGYDDETRADLSNLHHVLEALKETELPAQNAVWDKALTFIQRTQNRKESNDQSWAGGDGGFVYMPGMSFAGETKSYGSMTYAGLLSFSYANLKKGDPRVLAAYDWLRTHYSVDENPGLGKTTLYYYYMVFAKGLAAYGEPVITDAKGVRHNWREELGKKLLSLQHPEGYWVNTDDPSHWQDNKALVTSFTLIAVDHLLGAK